MQRQDTERAAELAADAARVERVRQIRRVRAALVALGMPYDVWKIEGCWYVCGGDTPQWKSTCLNTPSLAGRPAERWVAEIAEMAAKHYLEKSERAG